MAKFTTQVKGRLTEGQSKTLWEYLQKNETTFSQWLREQIRKLGRRP